MSKEPDWRYHQDPCFDCVDNYEGFCSNPDCQKRRDNNE